MKLKRLLVTCLTASLCGAGTWAQTYYDITSEYLTNALFDSDFDFDKNADGDIKSVQNDPAGWTMVGRTNPTTPLLATFQYGTGQTFNGYAAPTTGLDGSARVAH